MTRKGLLANVGLVVLVTAALAVPAGPAFADPGPALDPGSAAKEQTTPKYTPATGPSCTVRPSAAKSVHDEWLGCLGVEAVLDHAPAVGETATLTFTVRSSAKLGTDIRVELPAGLEWAKAPTGFAVGSTTAMQPERAGTLSVARLARDLAVGESSTYSGVVRATKAGPAQIQVIATPTGAPELQPGSDKVFLTIGEKGVQSRLGFAAADGPSPVAAVPTTARAERPASQKPRSVGNPAATTGFAPQAACDTRVAGNWSYTDQNGTWHNSMNFQVQVWDDDTFGDSLLAVGVTDFNGNYNICFDSQVEGFPDSGTADIYVVFVSQVNQWRVLRGGNPLQFQTGTTNDVATGSTLNLGSLTSGDATLQRGLHAYDEANDAWLWIPSSNGCFDPDDASCRQLTINWAPDSTDGTYYSRGSNDVHLAADDPNGAVTVVHEIGHAVMDDVYNDAMPPSPSCNPHTIQGVTSTGCAWVEGWAEWFPATVYNDPFFRWPDGGSLNLETPSWGNGWGEGDAVEGRVAGAMIDINDFANEATWDRYGEGASAQWNTFIHHIDNTFASFWASRTADGFNVADSGALANLFQNTIDYGFRDPIGNYAPLTRPTPVPSHNFSYNTTSIYWSAIAVRPPVGADFDLQLYDDRPQATYLSGSAYGSNVIDFVAVDSNRRALGDYYPRINRYSATGTYQTELAQGTLILSAGTTSITMGATNIVHVEDTYLTAGVPVTLSVAPTNAGQDPELFVMGSDPANAATFIRARSSALATATAVGAGSTETITFTPSISGWYGVVVTNKTGSGSYNLSRA